MNRRNFDGIPGVKPKNFFYLFFCGLVCLAAGAAGGYELPKDQEISAKKPVQIQSRQLSYDRLKSLTRYKGNVIVTHGKVALSADEVRAVGDRREASANGRVKVVDNGSGMTMTCGNLEYRDVMSILTAHDHPLLTAADERRQPVTLRGRQMELYSDKKEVVVNQEVEILNADMSAQAGKGTFVSKEEKIILEEEPKVLTSQGALSGRRIVARTGGSKGILVEGMADAVFYPAGGEARPKTPGKNKPLSPSTAPGPNPGGSQNPAGPGGLAPASSPGRISPVENNPQNPERVP